MNAWWLNSFGLSDDDFVICRFKSQIVVNVLNEFVSEFVKLERGGVMIKYKGFVFCRFKS